MRRRGCFAFVWLTARLQEAVMARVRVSVVPVAAAEAALALGNVWVLPVLPRAAAAPATVWVPPCRSDPSNQLLPSCELPYSYCRSCPTARLPLVQALSSSERAGVLLVPSAANLDRGTALVACSDLPSV